MSHAAGRFSLFDQYYRGTIDARTELQLVHAGVSQVNRNTSSTPLPPCQRNAFPLLQPLEARRHLSVDLIADIAPHVTLSSAPFHFMPVDSDETFLLQRPAASSGSDQANLWAVGTDGSKTQFASNVFAPDNPSYHRSTAPSRSGNRVIFGTASGGTVQVADLSEGTTTVVATLPTGTTLAQAFTPYKQGWLFGAVALIGPTANDRLYYTDGTAEGTVVLASIRADLIAIGTDGRPVITTGGSLADLWTTDGTPAGTAKFHSVNGSASSLVTAGGKTYFRRAGSEIWVTDGTGPGTYRIRAAVSGQLLTMFRGSDFQSYLLPQGDSVLFAISSTIYRTFGGVEDATLVTTLPSSQLPSVAAVVSGDAVFLVSNTTIRRIDPNNAVTSTTLSDSLNAFGDGAGNLFVWTAQKVYRTDGTTAGTTVVRDHGFTAVPPPNRPIGEDLPAINPMYYRAALFGYDFGAYVDGNLWLTTPDRTLGYEPHFGAPGNLQLVADLNTTRSNLSSSRPEQFVDGGNAEIFFVAGDRIRRLKDGALTTIGGSATIEFVDATRILARSGTGASVYDRQAGTWSSLGLSAIRSRNVLPLPDGSYLAVVQESGAGGANYPIVRTRPGQSSTVVTYSRSDGAYFRFVGNQILRELAGTLSLVSLTPLSTPTNLGPSTDLANAVAVGGQLFYIGDGALRVTDGTLAGTSVVIDPASVPVESNLSFNSVYRAGSTWFLVNTDGRLFRSDGTATGTVPVNGPATQSTSIYGRPVVLGDRLLFRSGGQLWAASADGTATRLSETILSNASSTRNGGIAVIDDTQAIALGQLADGRSALLRTDGTAAGTKVDAILNQGDDTTAALTPQVFSAGGRGFVTYNDVNVCAEPFEVTPTDDLAPFATSIAFDVDTNSVSLRWSEQLDPASLATSDLLIKNLDTGETFTAAAVTQSVEHLLRFTLPRVSDGRYTFSLGAGTVADTAGNAVATTASLSDQTTFILAGDANHDRSVNFSDLLILAKNYNQAGRSFSQGNFDYSADGVVGFNDLLLLAQRYNTSVLMSGPADVSVSARGGLTPAGRRRGLAGAILA
jgi:hypothetical protein